LIGCTQQRIDFRLFQVRDVGGDSLFYRHHPDLGAPFDMLWAVCADEPGQSVNRGKSLVPCGRAALPLVLEMSEKSAHDFGR
jgi:hypothetical protein